MATVRVARRTHEEQREQSLATLFVLASIAAVLLAPAALGGAAVARGAWQITKPREPYRWALAVLGAATVVALMESGIVLLGWPWRILSGTQVQDLFPALAPLSWGRPILVSALCESLAGPLLLQVGRQAAHWRSGRILGHLGAEELADIRAESLHRTPARPLLNKGGFGWDHPRGAIRLGLDLGSGQPFDIAPAELAKHVFVPGTTGSGKTTTLMRLADGALGLGMPVAIIDCKGGGLGAEARALAGRHGVPYRCVDPQDADSLGYAISGGPAEVSNKLLGIFAFGDRAEVYKHAVGQAIPPVVRALQALDRPITLDELAGAFRPGAIARLGRDAGEPHQSALAAIEANRKVGGLGEQAYVGLQFRLGALREGWFGDIFRRTPALDWEAALSAPSVTYLALSTTAAAEDVELFSRMIAQDLKLECARRFRAIADGDDPPHVLVQFDEAASLREGVQLYDLLFQARQARLSIVVSTQYIPQAPPIRKACLSAGLIIAHRVEGNEDAELLAAQFGTRQRYEMTLRVSKADGMAEEGSARRVDLYRVHPNVLRELADGKAAVRSVPTDRRGIVQVYRDSS